MGDDKLVVSYDSKHTGYKKLVVKDTKSYLRVYDHNRKMAYDRVSLAQEPDELSLPRISNALKSRFKYDLFQMQDTSTEQKFMPGVGSIVSLSIHQDFEAITPLSKHGSVDEETPIRISVQNMELLSGEQLITRRAKTNSPRYSAVMGWSCSIVARVLKEDCSIHWDSVRVWSMSLDPEIAVMRTSILLTVFGQIIVKGKAEPESLLQGSEIQLTLSDSEGEWEWVD